MDKEEFLQEIEVPQPEEESTASSDIPHIGSGFGNATTDNLVVLRGNLGQDPQQRAGGCVELRLCTQRGRGERLVREWHTIKVFGKQAELVMKWKKKGHALGVIGRLTYFVTDATRTKDGQSKVYAEIVADVIDFK
jgi:single-stranded DNA-binding protein